MLRNSSKFILTSPGIFQPPYAAYSVIASAVPYQAGGPSGQSLMLKGGGTESSFSFMGNDQNWAGGMLRHPGSRCADYGGI